MARIFVTGSADGLGLIAGKQLVAQGHKVILHARNAKRAEDAKRALPQCDAVVIGDVSLMAETKSVAEQVNALGRCDAVIHNVAIGPSSGPDKTADGFASLFAINVVAPYLLTALITRPDRLVYMSSGMHYSGDASLKDPHWEKRRWNGSQAYSDSKLFDLILAMGLARRWPQVKSNAVDPGWVPTKMGGRGAPDNLDEGAATQVWLAASDDANARVTGQYFHHKTKRLMNPAGNSTEAQDGLIDYLAGITKVKLA